MNDSINLEVTPIESKLRLLDGDDYLHTIINLNVALFCRLSEPNYYITRALTHIHLRNIEEAIQDFSMLISTYKNEPEYFISRGYLYEKMGLKERAIIDYKKVLSFKRSHWKGVKKTQLFIEIEKNTLIEKTSSPLFLIIANPRTGSTWLELMLNCLPDVNADLEIKWSNQENLFSRVADNTLYPIITNHIFSLTVGEALDCMSTGSITGSKMIIDFNAELPNFEALRNKIDPDKIKIIHLTRSYHEIIESVKHGYYHLINDKHVKTKEAKLHSVLTTEDSIVRAQIPEMPLEHLVNYLESLLKIDLFFKSFENGYEYMRIDYAQINEYFYEIVRFVGSSANKDTIFDILSNPPTKKILSPSPQTNVDSKSYHLIEMYENIKKTIYAEH